MPSDPPDAPGDPDPASELHPVPAHGRARPRRRHVGRWVALGITVAVVAVAVAVGLAVRGGLEARDALTSALDDVPAVEQALTGGDTQAAQHALTQVQEKTAKARRGTSGPVWAVAGSLPGIGTDAEAFRTATRSVDDLAQDVLPPLVEASGVVDLAGLRAKDGGVDLGPLERAAPLVARSAAALVPVERDLDALDPSSLRPQLGDPVASLQDKVRTLGSTVTTAHRATALLPSMLGADGTRTYLLLSLNNAELRSSGGIPGSITVLRAKAGKVTVVGHASSADLGPWARPVVDLGKDATDVFGTQPARYPQDTTMLADFPDTGRTMAAMWKKAGHGSVDGVLATDPVALSHLLGATGPVTVKAPATGGGTTDVELTSDNAVDVLLSQVYAAIADPAEQDAFFSAAAGAVFDTLLHGDVPASDLQHALTASADERRLLVWSAHDREQALLAGTELSGALTSTPRGGAAVAVLLNDGTSGKMGYYLRTSTRLTSSQCVAGSSGTRRDVYTVTLRSEAPKDAKESLPSYVTGEAAGIDLKPGTIRTNVAVYTPQGVGAPVIERGTQTVGGDTHDVAGRTATQLTVDLAPGRTATLRVTLLTPRAGAGSLELWTTPTTTAGGLAVVDPASCTG
ncbi:DUF4012 domain-containing protein [Luteimicrobium sp. DT211]|uniref:DUF4012 domain-containing protein n=1 Tax=Luteimicrobium sp. DT211 TaxID=3393412 RepID=UPI003CEB1613